MENVVYKVIRAPFTKAPGADVFNGGLLKIVFLYVLWRGGCDPDKCTGLKMARLGLARLIKEVRRAPRSLLILNPFAPKVVSPIDRALVKNRGVLAVDGSWTEVGELFKARIRGEHRRLPYLIAGNPINYSKPHLLSTLEAVAATLYIVGFKEEAEKLLSIYKCGETFLSLNRELLEAYSKALDEEGVRKVEGEV